MNNYGCSNTVFPASACECGDSGIIKPNGIENIEVSTHTEETFNRIIVKYKTTVKYYGCYPVEEEWLNIEDFYKKYNIKFKQCHS